MSFSILVYLCLSKTGMMAKAQNKQHEAKEKQITVNRPSVSLYKSDTTMPAKKATDKDILNWVFIFITLGIF